MSTATTNRVEVRCPDCQSVRTISYSRYVEIRAGASACCRKCGNVKNRGGRHRPQPYRSDHAWRLRAACIGEDPEEFFPVSESMRAAEDAKTICSTCPVRRACLEDAIAVGDSYGIRGGMTAAERRRLVKARNKAKGVAV